MTLGRSVKKLRPTAHTSQTIERRPSRRGDHDDPIKRNNTTLNRTENKANSHKPKVLVKNRKKYNQLSSGKLYAASFKTNFYKR